MTSEPSPQPSPQPEPQPESAPARPAAGRLDKRPIGGRRLTGEPYLPLPESEPPKPAGRLAALVAALAALAAAAYAHFLRR